MDMVVFFPQLNISKGFFKKKSSDLSEVKPWVLAKFKVKIALKGFVHELGDGGRYGTITSLSRARANCRFLQMTARLCIGKYHFRQQTKRRKNNNGQFDPKIGDDPPRKKRIWISLRVRFPSGWPHENSNLSTLSRRANLRWAEDPRSIIKWETDYSSPGNSILIIIISGPNGRDVFELRRNKTYTLKRKGISKYTMGEIIPHAKTWVDPAWNLPFPIKISALSFCFIINAKEDLP